MQFEDEEPQDEQAVVLRKPAAKAKKVAHAEVVPEPAAEVQFEDDIHITVFDSSNMKVTKATAQSYIQAGHISQCKCNASSCGTQRSLAVSVSQKQSATHNLVIQKIADELMSLGSFTKGAAIRIKSDCLA